ncbi:hypothetical protein B9Z55_007052 [Caenorhabditis nigoni]|uniref:Uncharacterized protein n=1 Tax=Caenorhabditis nigoni TaxID=1611254 RepID=A0A2G5V8K2_9PELO|nr:hypothetical protein B9Z55_007052 [Caenorhabditis nigoni]
MVPYSVPMGYESLKAVLLHTDPSLRFKISQRFPKIRLIEKKVPLKIQSLALSDFTTTVNRAYYTLAVYRQLRPKEMPQRMNWRHVSCDVDQYGFEIPNSSSPILNGDVSFRTENTAPWGNAVHRRRDTEAREQHLQLSLRLYEDALAKLNQLESEGKTVEEFLAGPMTADDQRISYIVKLRKDELQKCINEYRNDLLPFHCRRNNLSSPFTYFIQLSCTQGYVKTIQRYKYNHKLYEAAKKLNEVLFANRPVIIVNDFQSRRHIDVWRLPVGLRISANSISACCGEYEKMVPIIPILDASKKLRNVDFSVTSGGDSNYEHRFVKNAQQLSIRANNGRINHLVRAFKTMENQQINIGFNVNHTSPYDYFQLLKGWMSTERSVGSVITFELRTERIGEEILEMVRSQNERTMRRERWVKVVLRNGTILKVSYWGLNVKRWPRFVLTAIIQKAWNSRKDN